MSDIFGPEDPQDPLMDAMFRPDDQPLCADDRLREAVLGRTLRVIRFRRRLKRFVLVGAMLGCYLAGGATVGFLGPFRRQAPPPAEQAATGPERPAPAAVASAKRPPASTRPSRTEALRCKADRHLEIGDLKSAISDYKRLINLASAEQRAISPEHDSWLLMALKDARMKETRNGR